MTCIIGLKENNKVYLGGDSAGISGDDYHIRKDKKVFKNGSMIFGFTDSFRMGQILQYSLQVPDHPKSMSNFRFMCSKFIPAVTKAFTDFGYIKNSGNRPEGGTFIVGYKECLYTIYSDFQVEELFEPFCSVGCGEQYAKGAMRVLIDTKMPPQKKIKKALEAVESFSTGVKGPFNIVSV